MKTRLMARMVAVTCSLALVGCWDDDETTAAAPVAAEPAALTVSGTAATGAALANAPVTVKCATGSGNGVTGSNGSFSISVAGGVTPCLLEATAGSLKLHSLVERQSVATTGTTGTTGTSDPKFCKSDLPCRLEPKISGALQATTAPVTANITPLSELLVAKLTGTEPAAAFASFNTSTQAQLTPEALTQAVAEVVAAFQGVVDLSGLDPLKGTLVPASGGTAGNTLDQRLDALAAALTAAQTTLAEVTTAVATATPVQTIVQPAATACAGLRSGRYRAINPHETIHDPAYASHLLTVDATRLTVTDANAPATETPGTLTPDPTAPCRFTAPGDFGTGTFYVSRSGVVVNVSPSSTGPLRTSFLIPEQTIPLSQLAGTWNYIVYDRAGTGPLQPGHGQISLDASGVFSNLTECVGTTCTPSSDLPSTLTANPLGGFTSGVDRFFAFKTTGGAAVLFNLKPNEEGLVVFIRQRTLPLPAVNTATTFWDFTVGNGSFRWAPVSNGASPQTTNTVTVTSTDATAQTFTRIRSADQRIDSFTVNSPYPGLRYRAATSAVSAQVTMPLADGGLTFYASGAPGQNFFGISINQP